MNLKFEMSHMVESLGGQLFTYINHYLWNLGPHWCWVNEWPDLWLLNILAMPHK